MNPTQRKNRVTKTILGLITLIFVIGIAFSSDAGADQTTVFPTQPCLNKGKKWRIGYLEGGPYANYQSILNVLIKSLMEEKWISPAEIPSSKDGKESETLWKWLSVKNRSDYLEFLEDGYWSSGWNDEKRLWIQNEILKRLNIQNDVDFMIAMGTWAGLDLANDRHSVPTMVVSSSDPLRAGIVKNNTDSGYDHLHAQLDPARFQRQLRLFHDIVRFKNLGLAYQDTVDGKSYAALEDARSMAKVIGYNLIEFPYPRQLAYSEVEKKMLLDCHNKLALKADAVYLTEQTGYCLKNLTDLLKPFLQNKVATFSQGGTEDVRYGVLVSTTQRNFNDIGKWHSEIMSQILNGAKPRELPYVFQKPDEIVLNLETARICGIKIPLKIIAGAVEVFEKIETAPVTK